MARGRDVGTVLDRGWQMSESRDGPWRAATVPQTVASALGLDLGSTRDLDDGECWWRKKIERGETGDVLRFAGLATIADVWIDGEHVLRSESMFVENSIDVRDRLHEGSEILLRFSPLARALEEKRPRPRWRATIVAEQKLRWFRTSLLGRIPAWTPPIAPVGPFRAITLDVRKPITFADVRARVEKNGESVIEANFALREDIRSIELVVGERRTELAIENHRARGTITLRDAPRWWPHTHGTPALVPVVAMARGARGDERVDFGATGFRTIEVDRSRGGFTLHVNGVRVFCRGASWMPLDVVGLAPSRDKLRAALEQARDGGMNMLRISGTMLYESRDFHELCDELGILVWQDFMFANMDYPTGDAGFIELARKEATELVDRLQLSPSLVVCCGGSEVEQQAAMMGLDEGDWSNAMFREMLPSIVRDARPDVAYVSSSPTGGALPFHVDEGVAHYYGVGAYLRSFDDARRAHVRFASECLAFANIPRDETIEALLQNGEALTQHPRWKSRVARDRGTSWDFEDVRDHYVKEIFDVDPAKLRCENAERYLELSRVATGEAMSRAMSEWRSTRSTCAGALIWFLRDLWEGAGWGVIDSRGFPKAPYYFLKRVLAPVALLATDEGLNGISLHAINERPVAIDGVVSVALYRGEAIVARAQKSIALAPHDVVEMKIDALLGRFTDVAHAYRFGPPSHDATVATFARADGEVLARAFHFPRSLRDERDDLGLEARGERVSENAWLVVVRTKKIARAVSLTARGFIADDDFFDIEPGTTREIALVRALPNASEPESIKPINGSRTRIACKR